MTAPDLQHVLHPDNREAWSQSLIGALDHLNRNLAGLQAPATGATPDELDDRIAAVDLDRPIGAGEALDELQRLWLDDAIWFAHPHYVAHLNSPVVIPSLVAELLLSTMNTSMDTFDQSAGATFIERRLIDWTCDLIGFPRTAGGEPDGIFTSGGTQSNFQALLLARGQAAARGADPADMRIIASAESHFSVAKSARLLGLGSDAVIELPTDERRRFDPQALATALYDCSAQGLEVMAVVATAGTTDFGAIDPIHEAADLCRAHDTWLHVDAAYGGGLLTSATHRGRLAGIERADSVTIDFHKTWFQPVSASAVLVRDASTMRHATWHADYLNPAETAEPNQVDKSLQTTRRFDALKLWMTLRVMGAEQIGAYVDTLMALTEHTYAALNSPVYEDLELVAEPEMTTLVLRWNPGGYDEESLGRINRQIRERLYSAGQALVAATRVDGRQFLKFTLLNPKTTVADLVQVALQIQSVGRALTSPAVVG